MAFTMQPVKSTQVESIGYDATTKKLRVKFARGSMYEYSDVPAETFTQMANAESVGKYFGANIKGKFGFEKLPEGTA